MSMLEQLDLDTALEMVLDDVLWGPAGDEHDAKNRLALATLIVAHEEGGTSSPEKTLKKMQRLGLIEDPSRTRMDRRIDEIENVLQQDIPREQKIAEVQVFLS